MLIFGLGVLWLPGLAALTLFLNGHFRSDLYYILVLRQGIKQLIADTLLSCLKLMVFVAIGLTLMFNAIWSDLNFRGITVLLDTHN